MNRQARRAAEHKRRGAEKDSHNYYRRRGLRSNEWKTLVHLTGKLIKILANKRDAFRASDAARQAQIAFDRTVAKDAPVVACRKGCAHCCHNFVSASPADIFRVARYIRENHIADIEEKLARIHASEDNTRKIGQQARFEGRQPCALLVDGACSVYKARPMACRGWASMDAEACESWSDSIPVPEAYRESRRAIDFTLRAALKRHEHDKRSYELNHAVRVALEDPDSESRWLAGEDVFKDVQVDQSVTDPAKLADGDQIMDALIHDATQSR